MRVYLIAFMAITLTYRTQGQPVECGTTAESSCDAGYYCVPGRNECRKCIDCEELKRETLPGARSCIQSVSDCGSCFKGLVPDLETGINCVLPESMSNDGLPGYVWAAVGVGLFLFLLVVVIVVYVLRNTYTFKILASTRTSVQSPCNRNVASAPEMPPPYNALYSPVRPSSPPADLTANNESSYGYVKRASSERRGAEGRESAGSQAARVYNNPSYVRAPHLHDTPSYEVTSEEDRDPLAHDEDTMESTWTPTPDDNHNTGAVTSGAGELSTLLAAARSSNLLRAPHCAAQDSNNNRNAEGSSGGESAPSTSGPSFIINVVQNINAVQQQNDVTV